MNEETYIYYYQGEPVSAAFADDAWSYAAEDEEEQRASKELQRQLEDEYNLPVGGTSVGTGAAQPGFLIVLPSAIISGAIWLFFQGKEIQPNLDAWKALYDKYFPKLFRRRPSFDRGGALVLAILALAERLGHEPDAIQLISYGRRSTRMDPLEIVPAEPGRIDERSRIEAATVHIFVIRAEGSDYVIKVHGQHVTFVGS